MGIVNNLIKQWQKYLQYLQLIENMMQEKLLNKQKFFTLFRNENACFFKEVVYYVINTFVNIFYTFICICLCTNT